MGELAKLLLETLKSGKTYAAATAVSCGSALFLNWKPLKDKTKIEFGLALALVFCCTILILSILDTIWSIIKKCRNQRRAVAELKYDLKKLHYAEKQILLRFAASRERFIRLPIQGNTPNLDKHLEHLLINSMLNSYKGEYGSYHAAGYVAYNCEISDLLWDLFHRLSKTDLDDILKA